MPEKVTFNYRQDRNVKFEFTLQFRNKYTGQYIDLTDWEFAFTLKNNIDVAVWALSNNDFLRPDEFTIAFEKSVAEVGALPVGNYTPSLLLTNVDMTDNEIMTGTWHFN